MRSTHPDNGVATHQSRRLTRVFSGADSAVGTLSINLGARHRLPSLTPSAGSAMYHRDMETYRHSRSPPPPPPRHSTALGGTRRHMSILNWPRFAVFVNGAELSAVSF